MSEDLREIICKPTSNNVVDINALLEDGIVTEQEVVEEVIDSRNTEGMYLVCRYVNISARSIGRIAHTVCKLKNAIYIYKLARDVSNAPVEELSRGIIATHNLKYIYEFAKNVEKSNKVKLGQAIIDFKVPYYILKFALNIRGYLDDSLENAILEVGNAEHIYDYATCIPNSDKERLVKGIIKTQDSREMFYFLRDFGKSLSDETVRNLVKRIIELKNSDWIYLATTLNLPFNEEFNVDTLADGLIAAKYDEVYYGINIVLFAKDYVKRGAPIEKLANALVNVNSFDNIVKLIIEVPEVDACKLIDFLMNSVDINTLTINKALQCLFYLALENQYFSDYAVEKLVSIGDTTIMNSLIVALKDDNIKLTRILTKATLEIEMAVDENSDLAV